MSPDTDAILLTGKSTLEARWPRISTGGVRLSDQALQADRTQNTAGRIAEKRELTNKYRDSKRQLERIEGKPELIGELVGMDQVRKLIAKVAPTNSTVLILGETGTGKELVARTVHDQSLRREMPFVAINCGGLPESLIESELFGHRRLVHRRRRASRRPV